VHTLYDALFAILCISLSLLRSAEGNFVGGVIKIYFFFVFIALAYGLDDRGFESQQRLGIFSSPPRPDRLWSPPNFPSNEFQGFFPWGQSGRGVKLTTHFLVVARSNNEWNYTSTPPICLHGVVLS
jgi:hypothetical protein